MSKSKFSAKEFSARAATVRTERRAAAAIVAEQARVEAERIAAERVVADALAAKEAKRKAKSDAGKARYAAAVAERIVQEAEEAENARFASLEVGLWSRVPMNGKAITGLVCELVAHGVPSPGIVVPRSLQDFKSWVNRNGLSARRALMLVLQQQPASDLAAAAK